MNATSTPTESSTRILAHAPIARRPVSRRSTREFSVLSPTIAAASPKSATAWRTSHQPTAGPLERIARDTLTEWSIGTAVRRVLTETHRPSTAEESRKRACRNQPALSGKLPNEPRSRPRPSADSPRYRHAISTPSAARTELLAVREALDAELIVSEILGACTPDLGRQRCRRVIGEPLLSTPRPGNPRPLALLAGVAYLGTPRQPPRRRAPRTHRAGVPGPWADRSGCRTRRVLRLPRRLPRQNRHLHLHLRPASNGTPWYRSTTTSAAVGRRDRTGSPDTWCPRTSTGCSTTAAPRPRSALMEFADSTRARPGPGWNRAGMTAHCRTRRSATPQPPYQPSSAPGARAPPRRTPPAAARDTPTAGPPRRPVPGLRGRRELSTSRPPACSQDIAYGFTGLGFPAVSPSSARFPARLASPQVFLTPGEQDAAARPAAGCVGVGDRLPNPCATLRPLGRHEQVREAYRDPTTFGLDRPSSPGSCPTHPSLPSGLRAPVPVRDMADLDPTRPPTARMLEFEHPAPTTITSSPRELTKRLWTASRPNSGRPPGLCSICGHRTARDPCTARQAVRRDSR